MTTSVGTTLKAESPAAAGPPAGRRPGPAAWALLAPLLLWLLILVALPTAIIVVFSFCQNADLGGVTYAFTLENYTRLIDRHEGHALLWAIATSAVAGASLRIFVRRWRLILWPALAVFWIVLNVLVLPTPDDADAARWVKITVVSINYAAASTAACVVLGYPVAYFIGKSPARWRNLLLLSVMIPFWTSFLVRTYAWVTIFRENGVLNSLLRSLHWIDAPLELYPSQTAVMVGLIYTYLPFMILPIYTSIERLDDALIEAALDLGASPLRAFTRVILPLTRPGIVAGVVLVFVPAIGMFAINDILGGNQEMLIGNVIENQFTSAGNKPFGSAVGTLLLVLFVVTYLLTQRPQRADR